ncbi:MAG: hypothetical protein ABH950_00085 [Candidatus Altiarchaeota archaeon]
MKKNSILVFIATFVLALSFFLYISTFLLIGGEHDIPKGVDAADRAVVQIEEACRYIYVHGHPQKTLVNVYVPSEAVGIIFDGSIIQIKVQNEAGITDVSKPFIGSILSDCEDVICPYVEGKRVCEKGNYMLEIESLGDVQTHPVLITCWKSDDYTTSVSVEPT